MFGWKDLSKVDFQVVTLLEAEQLAWLYRWKDKESMGILMNHYPTVSYFLKEKNPALKEQFTALEEKYKDVPLRKPIKEIERAFVESLEDWIIYAIDPDSYDRLSFNRWDDEELLSIVDFQDKVVMDVGSGTGSQLFRIAPLAKIVYSVEPVGNLRRYLKDKAKKLGYKNCFFVDGTITSIPFPDDFVDVIVSGHVVGDDLKEELEEYLRVVKPGGTAIFMPGNNDVDNDLHAILVDEGWNWDRFLEPGPDAGYGWKRKYWKQKSSK